VAQRSQRLQPSGHRLRRQRLARRSETIRVYYPPDSNCLLSVFDHCLRSRNYVNIVTCGKQPQLQWLTWTRRANTARAAPRPGRLRATTAARTRRRAGLRRRRADDRNVRGVVAAAEARSGHQGAGRQRRRPDRLMMPDDHPHGMDNMSFDALFTKTLRSSSRSTTIAGSFIRWCMDAPTKPLPRARLHGSRHDDHAVRHGRAQRDEPLPSRHRRARARPAPARASRGAIDLFKRKLYEHHGYIREHLEDMPEIRNWRWTSDLERTGVLAAAATPRGTRD
jgi:xylulose-5-phosphate/fructose-6-phosphate phosphoketolase